MSETHSASVAERWPVGPSLSLKQFVMVPVTPVSPGLFRSVLSPEAFRDVVSAMVRARSHLQGTVIWNVSPTSRGGEVPELLRSLVAYGRGSGVDTRWAVLQARPEFFRITKRIQNRLLGFAGGGGELGEREHRLYQESVLHASHELSFLIRRGDVAILHDPETAGLAPELRRAGAKVVWRCHAGTDTPNEHAMEARKFLDPYVAGADAYVFSRPSLAWDGLDQARIAVIPPSIDPFSPKNNELTQARGAAILIQSGLLSGYASATPYFVRPTGTIGLVERHVDLFQTGPAPLAARLVVQVSRWDRLKDPVGVLRGFAGSPATAPAHLIIAGPELSAAVDDPESGAVLDETLGAWWALPEGVRERVHIACLPMQDADENAAIVNALQRRAAVVVQKSLAEGFGLSVSEAMWKARPVVVSGVGGLRDQVEDHKTGLVLEDPTDLEAFGTAVSRLLAEPELAATIGTAAHERVRLGFLSDRHLQQYADLLERLVA